ncbi:MAG: hypothetical protein NTX86_05330 [Candidatus Dependentiae bacterium]|nr:hypothetical protein [Candidatus Dependentiae bacterium]
MLGSDLISIFFRLLNFIILIVAGVYLFKRYAVGAIQNLIIERQQKIDDTKQEIVLLKRQELRCEQELVDQQVAYQELGKKVEQWHQQVAAVARESEKQTLALNRALQHVSVVQNQYMVARQVKRLVLPQALSDARLVMIKEFAAPEKGELFVAQIIKHVERR